MGGSVLLSHPTLPPPKAVAQHREWAALAASKLSRTTRARQLGVELRRGLQELSPARKTIRLAEKETRRRFEELEEDLPDVRLRTRKPKRIPEISNKEYRAMAKLARTFGLDTPRGPLTTYSKRRIRENFRELEALSKSSTFVQYPKGITLKRKKALQSTARKSFPREYEPHMVEGEPRPLHISKKGMWVPRSDPKARRSTGVLKYDKQVGAYAVVTRGKRKPGGQIPIGINYIAGDEVLPRKEAKLIEMLERLPPLGKRERFSFAIGGRESQRTFSNIKDAIRYMKEYRKTDAARASFISEATLTVVTKGTTVHTKRGSDGRIKGNTYTKINRAYRLSNMRTTDASIIQEALDETYKDTRKPTKRKRKRK